MSSLPLSLLLTFLPVNPPLQHPAQEYLQFEAVANAMLALDGLDPLPPYEGNTHYRPFRLDEPVPSLHRRMDALLEQTNFIPMQRYERFSYHNELPKKREKGDPSWKHYGDIYWSRIIMWEGAITSVREQPGGWFVRVLIKPKIMTSRGMSALALADYYYEDYHVSKRGVVTFVGVEQGTPGYLGGVG